jgi:hypothetical protein
MADDRIDLTTFFGALETNFPLSGVRASLSKKVGGEVAVALERAGLLTFLRSSDTYPCPQPGGAGCPRRVLSVENASFVAVCGNDPPECDEVRLSLRDVELVGVVPERFLEALRRPLRIGGTVRKVEGLTQTYQAGVFVPQRGVKYPVFFIAAASQDHYATLLDALRSRVEGSSFAVIVPTDRFVSAESIRQFRALGIPIVALADTLCLSASAKLEAVKDFLAVFSTIGRRATASVGSGIDVFAEVLTATGWRSLTKAEYHDLVAGADGYAIFADEHTRTAVKAEGGHRKKTDNILPSFFRILQRGAEASGRFDPNLDEQDSSKQIFQRARKVIDIRRKGGWVLFKTEQVENHAEYRFQPDSEVEFALIFLPKS